jgi:hypothetical protein
MVGHGRALAATGLHQFLPLACTVAAGPLATDAHGAALRHDRAHDRRWPVGKATFVILSASASRLMRIKAELKRLEQKAPTRRASGTVAPAASS